MGDPSNAQRSCALGRRSSIAMRICGLSAPREPLGSKLKIDIRPDALLAVDEAGAKNRLRSPASTARVPAIWYWRSHATVSWPPLSGAPIPYPTGAVLGGTKQSDRPGLVEHHSIPGMSSVVFTLNCLVRMGTHLILHVERITSHVQQGAKGTG